MLKYGLFLMVFVSLAQGAPFHSGAVHESVHAAGAPLLMNVGGGMIVGDLTAMPGIDMQITTKVASDAALYVGGEVGTFFLTGNYNTAVVIPLLATAFVEFGVGWKAHPVLGASLGPTISTGDNLSNVRMSFLFNPGVNVHLQNALDLNLLARFGVIGTTTVFLPQIGLTFPI